MIEMERIGEIIPRVMRKIEARIICQGGQNMKTISISGYLSPFLQSLRLTGTPEDDEPCDFFDRRYEDAESRADEERDEK